MEFKHCPIKKSHATSMHEREVASKQREDHVQKNSVTEKNEPCCAHFEKKNYASCQERRK